MSRTVCLLASPRPKGNSAAVLGWFLDKAKELGENPSVYSLNDLDFRGCQGCLACKKKLDHCALKDDLTPVLDEVSQAQNLVIATPVYWMDASAQLKTFVDRCYSFLKPDYLENPQPSRLGTDRNLIFILVQGGGEHEHTHVYPHYEEIFRWLGYGGQRLIRSASTRHFHDVDNRTDVKDAAEKAALELFGR